MSGIQVPSQLRASHFNLGNNTNFNRFQTSYQATISNASQNKGEAVTGVGDKLNLRESHFTLGSNNKGTYSTTNNAIFQKHGNPEVAILNEDKKKELRMHHFTLGQFGRQINSMSQLTYIPKDIPKGQQQAQEELKLKMISHHHDFAESKNKQMTTLYNDQFNQKFDNSALNQGLSAAEIKDKVVSLRNSHIVLGKQSVPMKSITQNDYQQKHAEVRQPFNPNLQSSHFSLGTSKNDYFSTNQLFHYSQPNSAVPVDEDLKRELRASHFTLGADSNNWKTQAKSNFLNYASSKSSQIDNKLQENHFSIGIPNSKNNFTTSYADQMKNYGNQNSIGAERDQQMDRGSSFKLGNQGNSYQTEAKDNFIPQVGKPSVLQKELSQDLRSHHFQFNDIKPQYNASSQTHYNKTDGSGARGELDEKLVSDLRSHHFGLGQQDTGKITTHNHFFKKTNGAPATLNKQKMQDLRTSHFQLG